MSIYPNPPTYENTDDYISNITGAAPRKERQSSSTIGDDFDRKKLYGTIGSSGTKRFEEEDNSCGTCCVKFFLFILNGVFLAAGGLVIAMGILVLTRKESHIIGKTIPIVVIAVGAGLVLFAIYGMVAAKVNVRCLLLFYLVLLVVMMLVFLAFGVVLAIVATKPNILKKPAEAGWKAVVKVDPSSSLSACNLQDDWKCSGFDNPCSAAIAPTDTCPECPNASDYFNTTCWSKLQTDVKHNMMYLVIGDGSAFAVVLFAMIFTCCLCRRKVGALTSERLLYKNINNL